MSGRDNQPATVPPPVGEDDAYSAATKVGAMPADIREKLRAEGLLPDEEQAQRVTIPNAAEVRGTSPVPPADSGPVPQLYSVPPPPNDVTVAVSDPVTRSARPTSPVPESTETPIAFTKPPPASLPPAVPKLTDDDQAEPASVAAPVARAPSKTSTYVVAALVIILLIVALVRLSR